MVPLTRGTRFCCTGCARNHWALVQIRGQGEELLQLPDGRVQGSRVLTPNRAYELASPGSLFPSCHLPRHHLLLGCLPSKGHGTSPAHACANRDGQASSRAQSAGVTQLQRPRPDVSVPAGIWTSASLSPHTYWSWGSIGADCARWRGGVILPDGAGWSGDSWAGLYPTPPLPSCS